MSHEDFMRRAIALSREGMERGDGGPFGAVIAHQGEVVGEGWNRVVGTLDPTAHAEVVAIRQACARLGRFDLRGCQLYTSCEPCPMCLSAAYWARVDRLFYANDHADAARIGFDDSLIYREVRLPMGERQLPAERLLGPEAWAVFEAWLGKPDRVPY